MTVPGRTRRLRLAALVLLALLPPLSGCRRPAAVAHSRPEPPNAAFRFRNVAAEAGLQFRWGHGGRTPLNILETLGHGCGFLDYDGDGLLDVWLLGSRGSALYRNRGQGRFEDVTAAAGANRPGYWHGIAAGDFDDDGTTDLCMVGYRCLALLRNAQGRFTDVTRGSGLTKPGWGSSCGFADLDGDGRLDLVIGDYLEFGPQSVQLCTAGTVKAACGPKIYPPRFPRVYHNVQGRFQDVTAPWGFGRASGKTLGITFGDFNGDGLLDVAFANDEMPQDLFLRVPKAPVRFRNEGTDRGYSFLASGDVQSGMGIDAADYNHDGREDLVITNFQNEPDGLYRNDGDFFTEVSTSSGVSEPTFATVGWGVRFFDADNDGNLDLITANGHIQDNVQLTGAASSYPQPLLLLANDGNGHFRSVGGQAGPEFAQPFVGRGLAVGDYDNDGRLDVLVVDLEGAPRLLRNESPAANHWIGLDVRSGRAARPALGALVTLEGAGYRAICRSNSCGSIFSAQDPRVYFGLGARTGAERLLVDWPDGRREQFPVPAVDRYQRIVEGSGQPR